MTSPADRGKTAAKDHRYYATTTSSGPAVGPPVVIGHGRTLGLRAEQRARLRGQRRIGDTPFLVREQDLIDQRRDAMGVQRPACVVVASPAMVEKT